MLDPVTGEWAGPWPPDPSWDVPEAPILPPPTEDVPPTVQPGEPTVTPTEAPEAAQARAAADAVFADQTVDPGTVKLGMPRPVPDDAELIGEYEAPSDSDPVPTWNAPPDVDMSALGAPDAVSGGEAPPPAELAAPAPALLTNPRNAEQAAKEAEAERIANLTPEQLAYEQFLADQAAENDAATKRLEASAATRQQAEENERVYREAVQRTQARRMEIDAEASRLANEKVDPDGWRNSRNLFQTISMYVAGIVGGLVQSRSGGPNVGLQIINDNIERHIAAQRENLAHRRAMIGDQRAALGEEQARADYELKTEEAFRQAAWQRAIEQIEADKAQFDPQGTAFRKRAMFQQQMQAAAAQAQQAAYEADLKRQMEIGKYDLEVAKHNETVRHNVVGEQMAAAKAAKAGAGGTSASKLKQDPLVLAQRYGVDPKFVAGLQPMTESEFRNVVENARAAKGLNDPSQAEKDVRDLAIGDPRKKGEPLRQADGTVFLPPSFSAKDLQAKTAAARRLTNILDEVEAIRNYSGGESEWTNSPEYQRLVTLRNDAIITKKASTEGMSSDEDMQKIAAAVGVDNLTSFRSQAAKLKQARINVEENLNGELRAAKYTGDPVKFPNLYKKPKQTPDQRELARIKGTKTGEKGQSIPTAAIASPLGAIARVTESAIRGEDPDASLPTEDRSQIDSWAKAARGGDATARANIEDLARENTRSPAVRKYAMGIMADLQARELQKATGKKPGDKGFLSALRKQVGYVPEGDEPDDDDSEDEEAQE